LLNKQDYNRIKNVLFKKGEGMRQVRFVLSLTVLLLAMLACNAATGIRTAQTEVPALMTEAPTALGPIETAAAEFTPPAESTSTASSETPSVGRLGIKLEDVKTVMQVTQQFAFSDGTVDGKPAAIAKLSSTAATSFPTLANGFSAAFIGDTNNLSEIKVTLPRTKDQATVDEGIGLATIMFAGILPADVQVGFLTWMTQNYSGIPVGGSKETTVNNFKFTLSRTDTEMLLEIVPAK
jgi:hypothetical protein